MGKRSFLAAFMLGTLGVVVLAGCTRRSTTFECTADSQCLLNGLAGRCVDGGCAFPSAGCASGLQFDPSAPSNGGQCVAEDAGTGGAQSDGGGDMARASCTDGVQDGTETDVDCGGASCPACADLKGCDVAADCTSVVCESHHCQPPTCVDGIRNGTETDIDCGGSCPTACAIGQHCNLPSDCATGGCVGMVCVPASCTDGIKDGNETAIDCGGGSCPTCLNGQGCTVSSDCWSQHCDASLMCEGCPNDMVSVAKAGGGTYCVDADEVTTGAYQMFVIANPPTSKQPVYCMWNVSYTPTADWPYPQGEDAFPVHWVDWCDAYAYCAWAGKRLCGALGGGATGYDSDFSDPTKDEWMNACDGGNVAQSYPYGSSYNAAACNGADSVGSPEPATQIASCIGSASGLNSISGNVEEWENSCTGYTDTDGSATCHTRGGSYASDMTALRCDATAGYTRATTNGQTGFRCCGG